MQQKIRKEKIGITISPNLRKEAEEIMDEVGIPTLSDFISQAVIVYIDRYKHEQQAKKESFEPTAVAESIRHTRIQ